MFQNLTKKNNHNPLPYTQAQQDIIKSTEPAIIIEGIVGSGKSQLLLEIAQKHQSGLYLATNKTVVKQVEGMLPFNWRCRTFNSLGLGMCHAKLTNKLRNSQGNTPGQLHGNLKVDFRKPEKLYQYGAGIELALDHIRRSGDLSDEGWKNTCDDTRRPYFFIDKGIEAYNAMLQDTDTISAEEMLYWPVLYGWKPKKVDVLMIDNYQDLNPLQLDFIKLIPTKRIIFAGEENQTIFQFNGARDNNKKNIKRHYGAKEYNLTESFTCPQKLSKYLSPIIPNMVTHGKPGTIQKMDIDQVNLPNDCLVLSGSTARLAGYAMQLLKQGYDFTISPSIIHKLRKRIDTFAAGTGDMKTVLHNFDEYAQERRAMHARYGWDSTDLDIRLDNLSSLLYKFTDYNTLMNFINSLDVYKDIQSPGIRLMTIHTAKGLKHDDVFLFTQYGRKGMPANLKYVGATRSTKNLTLIS